MPINDNLTIYSFKQAPKNLKLVKNTLLDRTSGLVVYNLPSKLNCSDIGNKYSDKDFYLEYGWASCFECDIIFYDLEELDEHQEIHLKEEKIPTSK